MKFKRYVLFAALVATPVLGSASERFSLPCNSGCSIHANTSTQFLIYGSGVSYGYAYFDIYAGNQFVCTTNSSNNTPIWQCNGSISATGTYTVTGYVRGSSNLHSPGDNATMQLTVIP